MNITFGTRTNLQSDGQSPAQGSTDVYTTDLEVANLVLFQGPITRQPWLPSGFLGTTLQDGYIGYALNLSVRNPANPTQVAAVGRMVGAMELSGAGKYSIDNPPSNQGQVRILTNAVGNAKAAMSNFTGSIQGRVPAQAGLWGLASRASSEVTKTYAFYVNGAVQKHTGKFDPVSFNKVTLGGGPLGVFPDSTASGSIDYDYEAGNWYLDVNVGYNAGGTMKTDHYTGTVQWVEDPNRATNGKGAYQLNVLLNQPPVTPADVFASKDDVAALFATDTKDPGFTGSISYVDTLKGDTTLASKVTYAVDGNQVSQIQALNFAKMMLLIVGPWNDD
jgi:hypothetical protein